MTTHLGISLCCTRPSFYTCLSQLTGFSDLTDFHSVHFYLDRLPQTQLSPHLLDLCGDNVSHPHLPSLRLHTHPSLHAGEFSTGLSLGAALVLCWGLNLGTHPCQANALPLVFVSSQGDLQKTFLN